MNDKVSRRDLLAGAAGVAAGTTLTAAGVAAQTNAPDRPTGDPAPAGAQGAGTTPSPVERPYFFFTDPEARFVEAAVDRLIPPDERWEGARWAGVPHFIDRQLASDWGAGFKMYLRGPWDPAATPQQGYQLRYPPAELYRIGIAETRQHTAATYGGREFWDLEPTIMDEVLRGLETSAFSLPTIPSPFFFETLLANTIEGFFADPAYGGNRDMIGWRMVGFPGAYASYVDLVDQYDLAYVREPLSFANEAARQSHIHAHDH